MYVCRWPSGCRADTVQVVIVSRDMSLGNRRWHCFWSLSRQPAVSLLMNKRTRCVPTFSQESKSLAVPSTPTPTGNGDHLGSFVGVADAESPVRSTTNPQEALDDVVVSPQAHREDVVPSSPATNRERFRASLMPSQITCDLSNVTVEPGHRFTFQGIVLVVFPASSNPTRRHVLVGDGRGTVGITVWNALVNTFTSETIGQLVVVTKVSVIIHNGTRGITLNKESMVQFNSLVDHFATIWWQTLPERRAVSAILFSDQKDNDIVNVAGIVGSVTVEQKTVRNDARDLVTIRLVDRTGITVLRSWNHAAGLFQHLVDSPVMIRRVRVTSYGSQKTGELFDGSGTIIDTGDFVGADDLKKFWTE